MAKSQMPSWDLGDRVLPWVLRPNLYSLILDDLCLSKYRWIQDVTSHVPLDLSTMVMSVWTGESCFNWWRERLHESEDIVTRVLLAKVHNSSLLEATEDKENREHKPLRL